MAIEADAEVKRFLSRIGAEHKMDLEALETGLRACVLAVGAKLLEKLLHGFGVGRSHGSVFCDCGSQMHSVGVRGKEIRTILGSLPFKRSWFVCPKCLSGRAWADDALDISGTSFSPGLRRFMARAGSNETFKNGAADLAVYAGVHVTAKDIERIAEKTGESIEIWQTGQRIDILQKTFSKEACTEKKTFPSGPTFYISYDGTGVPMVPRETKGRKGKQIDGGAKTREAKLGCVFTQTTVDAQGYPIRDEESTTYVGAIETSEEFGRRIFAEALSRGMHQAKQVVVIADGAKYNWEISSTHFPFAIEIVDLYHARQHLHALCCHMAPQGGQKLETLSKRWKSFLDQGKIEQIIQEVRQTLPKKTSMPEEVRKELGYLETNKDRMQYADFREKGLFVGSGVIEAGCKTIISQRLKRSGMEWTVKGANAIIALRTCYFSNRIEDFWEQRAAA
jgi:hypothetical protein